MSESISQTLYGEKSSNLNRLPILESKWNDSSSQVIQTTRGLLSNLSLDSANLDGDTHRYPSRRDTRRIRAFSGRHPSQSAVQRPRPWKRSLKILLMDLLSRSVRNGPDNMRCLSWRRQKWWGSSPPAFDVLRSRAGCRRARLAAANAIPPNWPRWPTAPRDVRYQRELAPRRQH